MGSILAAFQMGVEKKKEKVSVYLGLGAQNHRWSKLCWSPPLYGVLHNQIVVLATKTPELKIRSLLTKESLRVYFFENTRAVCSRG